MNKLLVELREKEEYIFEIQQEIGELDAKFRLKYLISEIEYEKELKNKKALINKIYKEIHKINEKIRTFEEERKQKKWLEAKQKKELEEKHKKEIERKRILKEQENWRNFLEKLDKKSQKLIKKFSKIKNKPIDIQKKLNLLKQIQPNTKDLKNWLISEYLNLRSYEIVLQLDPTNELAKKKVIEQKIETEKYKEALELDPIYAQKLIKNKELRDNMIWEPLPFFVTTSIYSFIEQLNNIIRKEEWWTPFKVIPLTFETLINVEKYKNIFFHVDFLKEETPESLYFKVINCYMNLSKLLEHLNENTVDTYLNNYLTIIFGNETCKYYSKNETIYDTNSSAYDKLNAGVRLIISKSPKLQKRIENLIIKEVFDIHTNSINVSRKVWDGSLNVDDESNNFSIYPINGPFKMENGFELLVPWDPTFNCLLYGIQNFLLDFYDFNQKKAYFWRLLKRFSQLQDPIHEKLKDLVSEPFFTPNCTESKQERYQIILELYRENLSEYIELLRKIPIKLREPFELPREVKRRICQDAQDRKVMTQKKQLEEKQREKIGEAKRRQEETINKNKKKRKNEEKKRKIAENKAPRTILEFAKIFAQFRLPDLAAELELDESSSLQIITQMIQKGELKGRYFEKSKIIYFERVTAELETEIDALIEKYRKLEKSYVRKK